MQNYYWFKKIIPNVIKAIEKEVVIPVLQEMLADNIELETLLDQYDPMKF